MGKHKKAQTYWFVKERCEECGNRKATNGEDTYCPYCEAEENDEA